ncbi:GNAT family N-acetyltransferase [Parasphingorhabdus cellanae]|uniref:GNAT family N-acetyltransferase n=1 Tax=Parasphingorhabdus cellanae TaxID=2806553 RepID=A0ABX7T6V0_9SPHN|nr:GNAT family N-acetyltransferase [Parasphingorhabdus cellanae]QTD56189.1 GNAT family N-acetyltransferase [Parasphingorhabdus cellanae]
MTSSAPSFLVKDGALSWPEIADMRQRIYPPEKLINTPMHGIEWSHAQRRVLLYVEREVRAVAGIHEREVLCDGQKTAVAGIGGVMTEPEFQGQGYGKLVMLHLVDILRTEGECAFGLLFCEDHNVAFYDKLGWVLFEGDLVVEQHGKTGPFAFRNTMVLPVNEPAKRTGHIDLCGLPW